MKRFILHIVLSLSCISAMAQIVVNDAEMKRCLVTEYPALMNPDSTLKKTDANNFNNKLSCQGYAIEDISIVSEFTTAWELNLEGAKLNNLTPVLAMDNLAKLVLIDCEISSLPDLSSMDRLNFLDVENCGLTSLPTLSDSIKTILISGNSIPSVSFTKTYPILTQVLLNGNNIQTVDGLENIPQMTDLLLGGNKLTFIQSLESFTQLERVQLWSNQLTTVEGLKDKNTLTQLNISNNLFETLPNLGTAQPSNYTVGGNKLTFEDLMPLATWPTFANEAENYKNQVGQGRASSEIVVEGGYWNWTLDFDQNVSTNYYLWFKDGEQIDSTTTGEFSISNFSKDDQGAYHCEVMNTVFDSLTITVAAQTLKMRPDELVKPVAFSPNGDGDHDELYIDDEGQVEIYDTRGNLIREFTSPDFWDGTDDSGAQAEFGYYFIKVNGEHKLSVTLVR